MNKKKILIVCRGFYPQNSPRSHRSTELAKEFARQGHHVTVLTPKDANVHPAFEMEHNISIHDLGTPRWKSPDFGKSRVGYLLTRAFNRLFSLAFEYPAIELMFMVAIALRKERNYDLMISIAVPYPIHWGTAWVWNKKQTIAKKWVADCGDPYMGCSTDSFKKWFYFKWVEKWFMRKADYITIPVESAKSAYYPEFHSKIRIISQGFKINTQYASLNYTPNQVPTFAYAGGFIPGIRDPRKFLEYLTKLNCDFRFYIFTNNRTIVSSFYSTLGNKLIVNDFIPREELLIKLSTMDFLVNLDNNTGTAVPSKLIDYAIIGRPVLNILKVLEEESIKRFLKGDYSGKMELPDIENYKIENVCSTFLRLCNAN